MPRRRTAMTAPSAAPPSSGPPQRRPSSEVSTSVQRAPRGDRRCKGSRTSSRSRTTRTPPKPDQCKAGDSGGAADRYPGRAQRPVPGHERRALPELARRTAHVASTDGALPLRRLEAQALLRREPRRDRFADEKDPNRTADRRDTYVGQQVTIFDNRGTCAHSGFCSDRLRTAFRPDQEPFVAPSGGRMDDLIAAVRACPSGALSFALGGDEVRSRSTRPPAHDRRLEGRPYRITGAIPLEDAEGNPEPRNEGASLEHYSLCRCGQSRNKPFCSGRHWDVSFRDPVPDPDAEPTLFEWAGGFPALTRMTRIFYGKYVPQDPLLAPLFADMSPDHPERRRSSAR